MMSNCGLFISVTGSRCVLTRFHSFGDQMTHLSGMHSMQTDQASAKHPWHILLGPWIRMLQHILITLHSHYAGLPNLHPLYVSHTCLMNSVKKDLHSPFKAIEPKDIHTTFVHYSGRIVITSGALIMGDGWTTAGALREPVITGFPLQTATRYFAAGAHLPADHEYVQHDQHWE